MNYGAIWHMMTRTGFDFSGADNTMSSILAHSLCDTDPLWVNTCGPNDLTGSFLGPHLDRKRGALKALVLAGHWARIYWDQHQLSQSETTKHADEQTAELASLRSRYALMRINALLSSKYVGVGAETKIAPVHSVCPSVFIWALGHLNCGTIQDIQWQCHVACDVVRKSRAKMFIMMNDEYVFLVGSHPIFASNLRDIAIWERVAHKHCVQSLLILRRGFSCTSTIHADGGMGYVMFA